MVYKKPSSKSTFISYNGKDFRDIDNDVRDSCNSEVGDQSHFPTITTDKSSYYKLPKNDAIVCKDQLNFFKTLALNDPSNKYDGSQQYFRDFTDVNEDVLQSVPKLHAWVTPVPYDERFPYIVKYFIIH